MKYLTIAIVLLAGTAGCATAPTYYHPSKTQADFERDKYDCEQDAYEKTENVGSAGNPFLVGDYHRDCMVRKHGYTIGQPQTTQSQPPTEPPKPKPAESPADF